MKNKKVLFITSFLPYPINDGGRQVASNIIKAFLEDSKVELVAFLQDESLDLGSVPNDPNLSVNTVTWRRKSWKSIPKYWIKGQSYYFQRDFSECYKNAVIAALEKQKYNLIAFDRVVSIPYIDTVNEWFANNSPGNKPKTIYFSHNIETQLVKGFIFDESNITKRLLKLAYLPDVSFTEKWEKRWLKRFDIVSSISSEDEKVYLSWGFKHTETYPPAFFGKDSKKIMLDKKSNKIKILSNFGWFPNNQGMTWFISEVWKYVLEEVPNALLVLGGKNIPEALDALAKKHKNIEIVGYIEDPDAFFNNAALTISPILSGSGIKLKVLRALFNGLPIVTTSKSLEGFVDEAYDVIPNTNDPKRFSDMVTSLLKSYNLRQELQTKELKLFKKHYSYTELVNYTKKLLKN